MTMIPQHDWHEISDSSNLEQLAYVDNSEAIARAHMIETLRLLWEERGFLLRALACGLVVFTAIAFLIPKRFESTTLLMPPNPHSGSTLAMAASLASQMGGALGALASDTLNSQRPGALFIGVLRSRTIQDDIINKFDLRRVYQQKLWENARRTLTGNTFISEDVDSGIISITVSDTSPTRAEQIAEQYVTELNKVVSQLSTSSARREREFLEGRLTQVKQDLETAEKDFSEFASKNGTVDIKEQGRAMVEGAATVEGQFIAAQSELQGLKQIYAENNVRVRSVRARIAELQNQLAQLGGKQGIAKDATEGSSDELYPSIRKLPLLGVPYADLYRRTRVQEAVFESLTQEYELAKVAEAKEIPTVRVLDPANVPEHKAFPPRLLIMSIGMFLSLTFAIIYLLAQQFWRHVPTEDPRKLLVEEVVASTRRRLSRRRLWFNLSSK